MVTASKNEKVSVSGTLTYADFKKHNSYHRRKNVIGYFIVILLFSIYVLSDLITNSILVYFLSLIIAGVLILLPVTLMDRNYSKAFKNDPLIKSEITYKINDIGISQKLSGAIANVDWKDLYLAIEEKDMFRLYVSKNKAIILPLRFFKSKEEINMLKRIIRRNMDAKKVKIKG